jgi:hypothetical protein
MDATFVLMRMPMVFLLDDWGEQLGGGRGGAAAYSTAPPGGR